jgi:hypothetical protein
VSLFVWTLGLVTGLIMVLTVLVVRRRHHLLLNVFLALVTVVVVAAGSICATMPPTLAAGEQSTPRRCPYDRLVWADMAPQPGGAWLACRRVARMQLALILLGAASITVAAGAAGLGLTSDGARSIDGALHPSAAGLTRVRATREMASR